MATLAVSNTFAPSTKIFSSQVNTNFSDIVNYINNRNSASASWDQLAVAGNGTITGSLTVTGTIAGLFGNGSAASPAFGFTSDTDCGMYRIGANDIGFATGGTLRWEINSNGHLLGNGTLIYTGDGTVASPAYSFNNDADCGMSRTGTNQITLNTNGTLGAYFQLMANGDILTSEIAPLATNATGGFFNLPTTTGTPTGVPTTYTGQKSVIYDTGANKLWMYNGSWRSVTFA